MNTTAKPIFVTIKVKKNTPPPPKPSTCLVCAKKFSSSKLRKQHYFHVHLRKDVTKLKCYVPTEGTTTTNTTNTNTTTNTTINNTITKVANANDTTLPTSPPSLNPTSSSTINKGKATNKITNPTPNVAVISAIKKEIKATSVIKIGVPNHTVITEKDDDKDEEEIKYTVLKDNLSYYGMTYLLEQFEEAVERGTTTKIEDICVQVLLIKKYCRSPSIINRVLEQAGLWASITRQNYLYRKNLEDIGITTFTTFGNKNCNWKMEGQSNNTSWGLPNYESRKQKTVYYEETDYLEDTA